MRPFEVFEPPGSQWWFHICMGFPCCFSDQWSILSNSFYSKYWWRGIDINGLFPVMQKGTRDSHISVGDGPGRAITWEFSHSPSQLVSLRRWKSFTNPTATIEVKCHHSPSDSQPWLLAGSLAHVTVYRTAWTPVTGQATTGCWWNAPPGSSKPGSGCSLAEWRSQTSTSLQEMGQRADQTNCFMEVTKQCGISFGRPIN